LTFVERRPILRTLRSAIRAAARRPAAAVGDAPGRAGCRVSRQADRDDRGRSV